METPKSLTHHSSEPLSCIATDERAEIYSEPRPKFSRSNAFEEDEMFPYGLRDHVPFESTASRLFKINITGWRHDIDFVGRFSFKRGELLSIADSWPSVCLPLSIGGASGRLRWSLTQRVGWWQSMTGRMMSSLHKTGDFGKSVIIVSC